MNDLPMVLTNIELPAPDQLKIVRAHDLSGVMDEIAARSLGYSGHHFFGSAFVQGGRLCFTTSMTIPALLQVCEPDRPEKGQQGILALEEASNRPRDAGHGRRLRDYLISTACAGEKFILPAFTLNFGITKHPDMPQAVLMLFVPDDGTLTWPAMLFLPNAAGRGILEVTDGAHRWSEINDILVKSRSVTEEQRQVLRENAVDVKIIFETNRAAAHQDFADCGKAKTIAKSLVVTWDIRDQANQRSVHLVKAVPFLKAYTDTTAANVNLSSKSRNIWSMSAVKMFVNTVTANHPERPSDDHGLLESQKTNLVDIFTRGLNSETNGLEKFFISLLKHIPVLKALEQVRGQDQPDITVGSLRDRNGGNLAIRGVAMALFARAYCYCIQHGIAYEEMASRLGALEWHLLTCTKDDIPVDHHVSYHDALISVVRPMWAPLLVIGDGRYRINSSSNEVQKCWERVMQEMYPESAPALAAAAE